MADEIVIKVDSVSKDFSFSRRKAVTIKSAFTGALKRKTKDQKTIQHALKDVSFEVKKGEFFGIVGRNGSGKSTLLKMLAGIYQPNEGKISVQGKLVPFIELGVGFNPELTGRENVYLNGALLNFSEKEIDKFYNEVVEFAELEQFMDKKLKNYSSGMQVRLAFSMAIRAKADILLIDEVLAVGDADFQRKCFDYFKTLKKNDQTVVFISHDMDAIRQFCDRAMLIDQGTIQKIGEVDGVASSYTQLFLGYDGEQGDDESGARWGEATGSIKEPKVTVTEKNITVRGSIIPQNDISNPLIGFSIKDAAGKPVLGANTKMLKTVTGEVRKAEELSFVWQLPNILADGRYTLDLALVRADGVTVIDWWADAKRLSIKKSVVSPYSVWPDITVGINKRRNSQK